MIRVATYNIHFGGRHRETLITQVLNEINADVIILTEASDDGVIDHLASELKMSSCAAHGRKTSVSVLSRLPIRNTSIFAPPQIGRPLLEVNVETTKGQLFTLFGLHLQCHFFKHNEKQRVRELSTYLAYIRNCNPRYHVILGDFNAVAEGDMPLSHLMPLKEKLILFWEHQHFHHDAMSLLQQNNYVDCFRQLNPTIQGYTLPSHAPNIRLDYIFASPSLSSSLISCKVHATPSALIASDHYPLYASFDV